MLVEFIRLDETGNGQHLGKQRLIPVPTHCLVQRWTNGSMARSLQPPHSALTTFQNSPVRLSLATRGDIALIISVCLSVCLSFCSRLPVSLFLSLSVFHLPGHLMNGSTIIQYRREHLYVYIQNSLTFLKIPLKTE